MIYAEHWYIRADEEGFVKRKEGGEKNEVSEQERGDTTDATPRKGMVKKQDSKTQSRIERRGRGAGSQGRRGRGKEWV